MPRIGTAVGVGAGTGTAFTGKQEIVLPSETELTFVVPGGDRAVTKSPEPVVERDAPEPTPLAHVARRFTRGIGTRLPPGLEKHVRRDELCLQASKRVEPLPADLDRQLPRLPVRYSRVVLSGRVMILGGDGEIVDLMYIYR